jgi:serine protease
LHPRLHIPSQYITMKILPPTLLLILAPYAIEARYLTIDGPPDHPSPTTILPDPHRFIVRYKNEEGKANIHSDAKKCHTDLAPQHAIAVTLSTEALESLQNNPNIEYVEEDYPRYTMRIGGYDSNDGFKQHMPNNNKGTLDENHRNLTEVVPYGIAMVQADQVSYDSRNPRTVCVVDTGYSLGHEDLPSTNVDGFSFEGNMPWNQDGDGHGTHVAGRSPMNVLGLYDNRRTMKVSQILGSGHYYTGTIAAVSGNDEGVIGVAPGVNLFIIRVFADDGSFIRGSNLVDATNRCKDAGANVINMSLGGSGFSRAANEAYTDLYTNDNILIVAAAGNDGNTPEGTDLSYPASYDSVMSVGAIDSNKALASFSQRNNQVDIAAPGVSVLSTVPMGTGATKSGTLDVSGDSYIGIPMSGSETGTASGFLVDCGLGFDDCTAARGQICLIRRVEIFFSEKVLACQNGGGLGAVIYNNVAGDLAGDLAGIDTQIPSMGIFDTDGEFLLVNHLGNSATLAVSISNYRSFGGTSMACPHVSAVAALIWSHDPTKTASEVRAALESTAEDLGAPGRNNSYGYGLVQAAAACFPLTGSSCTLSSSQPFSKPSTGPSLSSSPPSGSPSEQPSLAPSLPSNLGPRPFLAACSLDSDCLSNNCMDLVCRSSPTAEANKFKLSGDRGGTGEGGVKGGENRRRLGRRQAGPRGAVDKNHERP